MRDADVNDALRAIFKGAGKNYTLDPAVIGKVSADYKELAFEDALRLVLRQVGATWQVESDVVMILPLAARYPDCEFLRSGPTGEVLLMRRSIPIPPVVTLDKESLYVVRQGAAYKIAKATMRVVVAHRPLRKGSHWFVPDPSNVQLVLGSPEEEAASLVSDDAFLYLVRGSTVSKIDKATMRTVANATLE